MSLTFAAVATNIGVSIGSMVLSKLLAPDSDEQIPEAYKEDEDIPTVDQGRTIPKVFGTVMIKSPNLVWFGDSKIIPAGISQLKCEYYSYSFSGIYGSYSNNVVAHEPDFDTPIHWKTDPRVPSGDFVAYKNYLGLHMAVCIAPAKITVIKVLGRTIWTEGDPEGLYSPSDILGGTTPTGLHKVIKPSFYTGNPEGGGIAGYFSISNNLLRDPPTFTDDYLASVLPTDYPVPSFKGVTTVTSRKMYLGIKPTPDPWEFIVTSNNSEGDWLLAYAEVEVPDFITTTAATSQVVTLNGQINSGMDTTNGVTITGFSPNTVVSFDLAPYVDVDSNTSWSIKYDLKFNTGFNVSKADGSTTYFGAGVIAEKVDRQNARRTWDSVSDRSISGSTQYTFWLPDNNFSDNGDFDMDVIVTHGGASSGNISAFTYNPVHIVRDCLLNTEWGLSSSTIQLDDAAGSTFEASAIQAHSEGFGLSILWNKSEQVESLISRVLRVIDGVLFEDPDTGLFQLHLNRESTQTEKNNAPVFDESNIIEVLEYDKTAPAETINEVTVQYKDQGTGTLQSVTVQDLAGIVSQGEVVAKTFSYTELPSRSMALRVAQRELDFRSNPLTKVIFTVNRAAYNLNKSNIFKFSWAAYGVSSETYKVITIDYGDRSSGIIQVTALIDVFSLPDNSYALDTEAVSTTEDTLPASVTEVLVTEAAYYEVNFSNQFLFNEAASLPDFGRLSVSAGSPSPNTYQHDIYLNVDTSVDEGTYDLIKESSGFTSHTSISVELTPVSTSLYYNSALDSSVQVNNLAYLANPDGAGGFTSFEVVEITSVDPDTLEIVMTRGMLDTIPQLHLFGTQLWFSGQNLTVLDKDVENLTTSAVKLPTTNSGGEQDPNSAFEFSVTTDQRYHRPYPPADLKVNSEYFPEIIYGGLTLSWKHRDRTQQLQYVNTYQTDEDIGPESGVSYTLNIYDEADLLILTDDTITSNAYAFTTSAELALSAGADTYDSKALEVAPVAYYPLDEVSGSVAEDKSANSLDAVIASMDSYNQSGLLLSDNVFGFLSTNPSKVTHTNHGLLDIVTGDIVLECWMQSSESAAGILINNGGSASDNGTYMLIMLSTGKPRFTFYRGSGSNEYYTVDAAIDLYDGLPHMITFKHTWGDSASSQFVVDGSVQPGTWTGQDGSGTPVSSSTGLGIGIGAFGTYPYTGLLGKVWIGNIAETLSHTQEKYALGTEVQGVLNGSLRFELSSFRGGVESMQKYNHTVSRGGYGFSYGENYGGLL